MCLVPTYSRCENCDVTLPVISTSRSVGLNFTFSLNLNPSAVCVMSAKYRAIPVATSERAGHQIWPQ